MASKQDGIAQANMEALLVNGGLMEADLNNDAATADEEIGALEIDENLCEEFRVLLIWFSDSNTVLMFNSVWYTTKS